LVHRVRRFVCACFLTSELWGDVGPVGLNLLLLIRSVARGQPPLIVAMIALAVSPGGRALVETSNGGRPVVKLGLLTLKNTLMPGLVERLACFDELE
jgi:hypothetical protein